MPKPITVLKAVGPKLVPFFKTVAIFFVLYGDQSRLDSYLFCLVKCLPILSLMVFVLLHGMNFSDAYQYSRRVLLGLVCSCLGDICLVFTRPYAFEAGLAFFALAHILYTAAFGFRPPRPWRLAGVVAIGATVYAYLTPGLAAPLTQLCALYMAIISLMMWRAVARVQFLNDLWTWTKLCSFLGAAAFMLSDGLLALNRFRHPLPYAHPLVMLFYYAGQLGIALSVVDSQVDEIVRQSRSVY